MEETAYIETFLLEKVGHISEEIHFRCPHVNTLGS